MRAIYFRLLVIVAVSGTLGACADSVTAPAKDDVARRVRELGFQTEGMRDYGDYVIVEGDIRLEKIGLLSESPISASGKSAPSSANYQYVTDQWVSETYARQITVNLANVESVSDWATAARNAIADYNATTSGVRMSEASPADITFYSAGSLGGNAIAQASWPYQGSPFGKPGPTITVSQAYNDALTTGQKEKVTVHELGHTIGLRHDNAPSEGSAGIGYHQITGTPSSDPNSVMQPALNGTTWTGFSQYDLVALSQLYNAISITRPSTVAAQRYCTWTAFVNVGVPPYTYAWQVQPPASGSFYPVFGSQQSFTTYTGSYSGAVYISVQVTDANGSSWGRTVQATDTGFGGNYDHTYCT